MKRYKIVIQFILISVFVFCLSGCPYNIFLQTKMSVEGWLLVPEEYTEVRCSATHEDVTILDNQVLPNFTETGNESELKYIVRFNEIYKTYTSGGWNLFYFTCHEKHFKDDEVYIMHLDFNLTSPTKEAITSEQIIPIPYENTSGNLEMALMPEGSACFLVITSDNSEDPYTDSEEL